MSYRKWLVRSFASVLGLAVVATAALMGSSPATPQAEAQEYTCEQYQVCIAKRTIPASSTEFQFIIEIDEVAPSEVNGQIISGPATAYLSHGEEVGLSFRGEATVTEVPMPGWRLVEIDCEGSPDFDYEVHGNTLEIYYVYGTVNSFLNCTFVNERMEQQRQPLNLGGLFAGQPTPLPTAPAAVAPAATSPVISPPRTGDAGLK